MANHERRFSKPGSLNLLVDRPGILVKFRDIGYLHIIVAVVSYKPGGWKWIRSVDSRCTCVRMHTCA